MERLIRQILDSGDFILTDYHGTTHDKFHDYFFAASWIWRETEEFRSDGTVLYRWLPDNNPAVTGDPVFYEYDTKERPVKIAYDNSDFILTDYQGDTVNKSMDYYFGAGWVWNKAVRFHNNSIAQQYEWIRDQNPNETGDEVLREYDFMGKLIKRTFDNGNFIIISYRNIMEMLPYQEVSFKADWTWIGTVQYRINSTIVECQWFADQNPEISGDVIYEEYGTSGACTLKRYDNGLTVLN